MVWCRENCVKITFNDTAAGSWILLLPVSFFQLRDVICYNNYQLPLYITKRAFEITANFNQSDETDSWNKEGSRIAILLSSPTMAELQCHFHRKEACLFYMNFFPEKTRHGKSKDRQKININESYCFCVTLWIFSYFAILCLVQRPMFSHALTNANVNSRSTNFNAIIFHRVTLATVVLSAWWRRTREQFHLHKKTYRLTSC